MDYCQTLLDGAKPRLIEDAMAWLRRSGGLGAPSVKTTCYYITNAQTLSSWRYPDGLAMTGSDGSLEPGDGVVTVNSMATPCQAWKAAQDARHPVELRTAELEAIAPHAQMLSMAKFHKAVVDILSSK